MRAARLRMKAKLCRLGGYFCLAGTVFWCLAHQGPSIRERFQAEHGWPSATARVAAFEEHSRSGLAKKHEFDVPLYWTEFTVLLQIPTDQCPTPMRRVLNATMQCVGNYSTNWTEDSVDAFRWRSRHPLRSQVGVYYDSSGRSGDVVFAGEAIKDRYPWNDIARGVFTVVLGIVCFAIARLEAKKADAWEAKFPDEREGLSPNEPEDAKAERSLLMSP